MKRVIPINLTEIFYSIQGEGANTGMPAIFVRFAGCNLACQWCDTDHTHRLTYACADDLAEMIAGVACGEGHLCRNVVITGGEPTLQKEGLFELGLDLKALGFYTALETNGTSYIPAGIFDWVTVSPKSSVWCAAGDELKLVYTGGEDLDEYSGGDYKYFFLQPLWDSKTGGPVNLADVVRLVKEHPRWRVSLQTHKMIGIR